MLRSAEAAGRVLDAFYTHQAAQRQAQLKQLQTPTLTSVHGSGEAKVDGPVKLAVLADQVQASVSGTVSW